MNQQERKKIYTLLAQYFPNARQLRDTKTLTAWGLALERFPYADVKNAVISYAIANKFFPDLADITGGLTPEQTTDTVVTQPVDESFCLQARWVQLFQNTLRDELRRRGLPEFTGSTGADRNVWLQACRQAGLDVPALYELTYHAVYHQKEENL